MVLSQVSYVICTMRMCIFTLLIIAQLIHNTMYALYILCSQVLQKIIFFFIHPCFIHSGRQMTIGLCHYTVNLHYTVILQNKLQIQLTYVSHYISHTGC